MHLFRRFQVDLGRKFEAAGVLSRTRQALDAAGARAPELTVLCTDSFMAKRSAVQILLKRMPELAPFEGVQESLGPGPALSNVPPDWRYAPVYRHDVPRPPLGWDPVLAIAAGIPRTFPVGDLHVWIPLAELLDLAPPPAPSVEGTTAIEVTGPEASLRLWSDANPNGGRKNGLAADVRLPVPPREAKAVPALPPATAQLVAELGLKETGMFFIADAAPGHVAARDPRDTSTWVSPIDPSCWKPGLPGEQTGTGGPAGDSLKTLLTAALPPGKWKFRKGIVGFSGYGPWQRALLTRRTPLDNELTLDVGRSEVNGIGAMLYFRGPVAHESLEVLAGHRGSPADAIATIAARAEYLVRTWVPAVEQLYGPGAAWFQPVLDPTCSHCRWPRPRHWGMP